MAQEALTVVLASASPRRRMLLREAGVDAEVLAADVEEQALPGEEPGEQAARLARAKAEVVAARRPDALVIGADTLVVLGRAVFGKPASTVEAAEMLARLSGKQHHVLTGVCMLRRRPAFRRAWVARTTVRFRDLSAADIADYIGRVDPLDKAGAYGIQEHGGLLVDHIDGLWSNVVGLPVEEVLDTLAELR